MKLRSERSADDAGDDQPGREAGPVSEVADLRFHLARTRLRGALESLETAERLMRARGPHVGEERDHARVLIENARRELESLKSLLRGDGSGVV